MPGGCLVDGVPWMVFRGQAAACLILAEDSFMAVSLKAFKHKNIGMLKATNPTPMQCSISPLLFQKNWCHIFQNSVLLRKKAQTAKGHRHTQYLSAWRRLHDCMTGWLDAGCCWQVVRHITSHTASRSILLDVMGGGRLHWKSMTANEHEWKWTYAAYHEDCNHMSSRTSGCYRKVTVLAWSSSLAFPLTREWSVLVSKQRQLSDLWNASPVTIQSTDLRLCLACAGLWHVLSPIWFDGHFLQIVNRLRRRHSGQQKFWTERTHTHKYTHSFHHICDIYVTYMCIVLGRVRKISKIPWLQMPRTAVGPDGEGNSSRQAELTTESVPVMSTPPAWYSTGLDSLWNFIYLYLYLHSLHYLLYLHYLHLSLPLFSLLHLDLFHHHLHHHDNNNDNHNNHQNNQSHHCSKYRHP